MKVALEKYLVTLLLKYCFLTVFAVEVCMCQWVFHYSWSVMHHPFWQDVEWFWSTEWLWRIRWFNNTFSHTVSTPCMYGVMLLISFVYIC